MSLVAKEPRRTKPPSSVPPPEDSEEPQSSADDADWIARSVRFPPALYTRLGNDADAARRSTQLQIVWTLEEFYRLQEENRRLQKLLEQAALKCDGK